MWQNTCSFSHHDIVRTQANKQAAAGEKQAGPVYTLLAAAVLESNSISKGGTSTRATDGLQIEP
jgi:hypothetical protein